MASKIKWSAQNAISTVINGDASAPTLKNLANNGQKVGSEVDNSLAANRDQYGDFELLVRGASAFSSGGYVELYLIQPVDGMNYQDGDDSVAPPASALVGVFPLRAVNTQQRLALRGLLLPAGKFKPLVINKGGQAFTNTDNENVLKLRTFNDEFQ
jgi:hypothetical protein